MRILLALFMSLVMPATRSFAATIVANSTSQPDVQAAITASVSGDTVLVPAGLSVWTNNVLINGKAIFFQGSGTNSTIIVDENPSNRTSLPSLFDIIWQGTNGGMFDMSGFQLRGGTNQTATLVTGLIRLTASNNMTNDSVWRIHNNFFNDPYGRPATIRAWSGLMDSNTFSLTHHLAGMEINTHITGSENGDRSWNQNPPAGTTNLVYIEHNNIVATGTPRAFIDGFCGARYAIRFNTLQNRCVENHGTESTQRQRSTRYMEVYGNTFTQTGSSGEYALLFRGGSGLVFSNALSGSWPGFLKMIYFLSLESHSPWNAANGTNVWDVNYAGGPFETGTHTGTNGSPNLVDGSKTWTVDQWQKYSVIDYSQTFTNAGSIQHFSGLIANNTATSIVIDPPQPSIEQWTWNNGDVYKIWRVSIGLDAPGRGTGDLLVGGSSTVQPTPTTFPNEIDERIWYWNNTGVSSITTGLYPIVAGRDYTNAVKSGYTPLPDPHPLANGTNSPVVPPPPPVVVVFGQQPSNANVNTVISPPITALIEDANGAVVTTSTASVTISIQTNPGSGTLGGTLTRSAVAGVATFNDLSINNGGTGYRLAITSSGLGGSTSSAFNIIGPGPASQLAFGQQPSSTLAGAIISPPVTALVQDANGVLVTTSTATVTISIQTNPSAGVLSGTLSHAAVGGVATFSDLSVNNFGSGYRLAVNSVGLSSANSALFDITPSGPGPATQIAMGQQPSAVNVGSVISPAVTVNLLDANGAQTTSGVNVTVSLASGSGSLGGTLTRTAVSGTATFNNLTVNATGTHSLHFVAAGLTSTNSANFEVNAISPGPPAKLSIGQQPTTTKVGAVITPALTVNILDSNGRQTTSTATVTISLASGGGVLGGTLTRAAVSGVATFNNITVSSQGTKTLSFSSPGLTSATSVQFSVKKSTSAARSGNTTKLLMILGGWFW